MTKNIFPDKDSFLGRSEKENLLNQRGLVVWFTGLSGSGKSTLAFSLEQLIYKEGFLTQVLDGDKIRNGLNSNLGFSDEDRIENIRRIAEVSKLFCDSGIVTISAFISPTNSIRAMARDIIGNDKFFEVFLNPPIEICEKRDIKGLYKKAREGTIKDFTGVSSPYENPGNANLTIDTSVISIEESTLLIYNNILKFIKKSK
jgi:adenylylsulfate kinase